MDVGLEHRYRARSLWLDQVSGPLTPRPSLAGDLSCDVAIVGAGFTGLWTAYYLKGHQPDARVVVLEREIAGFGPAGRNGGWVSARIAGSWGVYAKGRGSDAVRRAEHETYRTVDEIGRVVERERIDCAFKKDGTLGVPPACAARDRPRERTPRRRPARARSERTGETRRGAGVPVGPLLTALRQGSSGAAHPWPRRRMPTCGRPDP